MELLERASFLQTLGGYAADARGGAGPAAEQAVRILAALPPGRELAWAYAGLGAFYGAEGRVDEGLELLGKARVLGELLHEPSLVSYALNQQGITLVHHGSDGTRSVGEALGIALGADMQEAAGLA